jgi:uncharacterized protein (DUF2147 family)
MKTLVAAFACAALAAGSMITAPAAFAQTVPGQTVVTTTTHTYHYGYSRRAYGYGRHVAYKPCGSAYGSCGRYLTGRSAETGLAEDMDYQAPIGEPVYANGDVALICSCDHRR